MSKTSRPHRRPMTTPSRLAVAALAIASQQALATDFFGIQPAALDQPRINALLSRGPVGTGTLLTADFGFETFNITAFYDTGASGILLSSDTAGFLGVNNQLVGQDPAIFGDVGVGGVSQYHISEQLHVGLAKFHPEADVDNLKTYTTVYNQQFGPVRTQIGPLTPNPDPILAGLDVFGMPTMAGKVVVMDPRPVNTFLDTMRTYVYNPGTPFNQSQQHTEPGIPVLNDADTDRHIQLSYGDFDRFTTTTPGAVPPSLRHNPFIGPNPVLALDKNPPPDNTPGVKMSVGSFSTEGSFLLDTGAAASIISEQKALQLGVSYDPNHPIGSSNPKLLGVPEDSEQFQLTIGGTGGTFKIAGFFMDSMLVRTQEGNAADDNDPKHFRFVSAPVLVFDISLQDPVTQQSLTLDGIFGMNYLVASAFVTETDSFPIIDRLQYGKFDWAVFDEPNGVLGLRMSPPRNQDELSWLGGFFSASDWDIENSETWSGPEGIQAYTDGDHVRFTDFTFDPHVRVTENVAPGGVTFDNTEDTTYRINGTSAITGFTGVIKINTGTVIYNNSNTYTGITDIREGYMVFFGQQDIGPVNVREDATLYMNNTMRFDSLNINGGFAVLEHNGSRTLRLNTVTVIGGGTLDLSNNDMILTGDDPVAVRNLIKQARNGGGWDAPGITSSTARGAAPGNTTLGVITGEQFKSANGMNATFNGFSVADSDVLVKYTYYGDSDFNGRINFDDYARIDAGFLNGGTDFFRGDLDYNGVVNFDDYALIDLAFLTQNGQVHLALRWLGDGGVGEIGGNDPSLAVVVKHFAQFGSDYASSLMNAVPEPALAPFALAGLVALRRRR